MKKQRLLIFFCSLLLSLPSYGQCWDNINTTTTDWTKKNSVNTWNWTQETFDMYITGSSSNPVPIISPFWATGGGSAFNNINLFDFQKHTTADKKDFHPNDGWELLIKHFGSPGASNNAVSNPYFCLYNRHTGKIRAFLLVPYKTNDLSKTGAVLKVDFPSDRRRTALFQHMEPIGHSVKYFNINLYADVANNYVNEDYRWLYSEFTVAYDPCTCHDLNNSKESLIEFTYYLVQESKIDAKIEGTLSEKVTENQKPVTGNPGFALTGFDDLKKLYQAGQKGYKEYGKYKDEFNKFLNNHTDSAWRGKIWRMLQDVKSSDEGFYNEIIADLYPDLGYTDLSYEQYMSGTFDVNPSAFMVLEKTDFLTRHYGTIKGIASFVPYVGAAIGVYDLLTSGGKSGSSTQVSQGPMVFEANLTLDGNLKLVSPISAPGFYTPGFTTSPTTNFIPTYNNILGVFNILDLPEFEFSEIQPNVINHTANYLENTGRLDLRNNCEINYSNFHNLDGARDVKFRQYKPKTPLKYVLNPASNMEIESVEAALIVKYMGKNELFLDRPSDFTNIVALPFYSKITLPDVNDTMLKLGLTVDNILLNPPDPIFTHPGTPNMATGVYINKNNMIFNSTLDKVADVTYIKDATTSANIERIKSIESSTNLQLDMLSPKYPKEDSSFIQFRTDYLPATCFNQLSLTLLANQNFPRAYVKIMVRLKHKTDPTISPVTLIFSYDIVEKLNTATNSNLTGTYDAKVWGSNWETNVRNGWKCSNSFSFTSADISNYRYFDDFKITSLPHQPNFFKPHDQIYTGQQNLTIIGNLTVPDNAVIPPNSSIIAGGTIQFGENVTIGSGSIIKSGKSITNPNNIIIEPNVILEIGEANDLKLNCSNYDYASVHLTNPEITSICNSEHYKTRAVLSTPSHNNADDTASFTSFNFNLFPNPNSGNFVISFENEQPDSYELEVFNYAGLLIHSEQLKSIQGFNTKKVELSNVNDGVYFIHLSTKSGTIKKTNKMIIIRN